MNDIKSITYKYTNTLRQLQISLVFIITIKNTLNMASNYTIHKKSVPYNTIRLSGDVAQWSKYEESYLDNSGYAGNLGLAGVSMKELQRANSTAIDPDGGNVTFGPLSNMRYGVSIQSDQSTTDGVYSSQIWSGNDQGNNNDFLSNRSYNSSGNPQNVRLSRLAQWDYTAFVHPSDLDWLRLEQAAYPTAAYQNLYATELFIDQPFTGVCARNVNDSSQRYLYIVRSNVTGDKYSYYTQNNYARVAKPSALVNVNVCCAMTSSWSSKNVLRNTANDVIFLGSRNSSNSSNITLQSYNIQIANNSAGAIAGSFNLIENSGNQITFGGDVGSNAICYNACFSHSELDGDINRDRMALLVDKGNGPLDLHHIVEYSGLGKVATVNVGAAGYSGQRGDVVHAYTGGNDLVFVTWTQTKSTYNRYCYFEAYELNSSNGITNKSYQSSPFAVIDASNQLKCARMCLLSTDASGAYFLIAVSDSSGDIRLRVVEYNASSQITTVKQSATFQSNNTSIQNLLNVSKLTAVETTALGFTGQGDDFVPGGTNDFEKRYYFAVNGTVGGSYNSDKIGYYYYDRDNNSIVALGEGTPTHESRGLLISKKRYEGVKPYTDGAPLRGGAGNPWTTIVGGFIDGEFIDEQSYLGVSALALDFKPNWGGASNSTPPGGNYYDLDGHQFTFDVDSPQSDTSTTGKWKVAFPHPQAVYQPPNTTQYSWQLSNSSLGTNVASIGASLTYLTLSKNSYGGSDFESYFEYMRDSYEGGDDISVDITTDNGNLAASYIMPAWGGAGSPKRIQYVKSVGGGIPYLFIDWGNISNSFSGDRWSFTQNEESVATIRVTLNLV
jgi:hypothetical protein